MKHIKLFKESIEQEPKKGDYILYNMTWNVESKLSKFLNNTIGQIANITKNKQDYDIVIFYNSEDIPEELKYIELQPANKKDTKFYRIAIINKEHFYYNKNKEKLETLLTANKYNL